MYNIFMTLGKKKCFMCLLLKEFQSHTVPQTLSHSTEAKWALITAIFSIQWLINNQNVNAFLPSDNKSDNGGQKEASRLYFIELLYSFSQHSHR